MAQTVTLTRRCKTPSGWKRLLASFGKMGALVPATWSRLASRSAMNKAHTNCATTSSVRRFGARVRPAKMTGTQQDDQTLIAKVANGPIDFVLDLLPREASPSQVLAAALAVRPGGRVVLM